MSNKLRTLKDAKLQNKIVIVRANLDVPLANGEIQDDSRIKAAIPTIQYLLQNNCKIVILAHLGRPDGKISDEFSLMPVRFELGRLLQKQVKFASLDHCENSIKFMEFGDVLLIENVRFFPEEESSNPKTRKNFIEPLANLADAYINDCFGLYRKHASVYELAQLLPSYAGLALEKEIEVLSKLREDFKSPYVAIIGGAKLDTKIDIISNLIDKVDKLIIGGGIAYTFLKAKGVKVGKSVIDKTLTEKAEKILKKAEKKGCEVLLPIDHICAESFEENAAPVEIGGQNIPAHLIGMDIGPATIELYTQAIDGANTVLWNGPMGVFEWKSFCKGTEAIGEYLSLSTPKECYKVAGGGDTMSAMNKLKILQKRFNHISLGGGMMLQLLSGEQFDVLDVLTGKQK